MKDLYGMINEALSKEWRDKLQALIDNDQLDDKTAKKMLGIAKQVSEDDLVLLNRYFADRGIDDDQRNIIRILKDYDIMDEFYSMIKDQSGMIDEEKFIKSDNVYSLFSSINPAFTKELQQELAKENPSRGGVTRGMFEILCQMFIKQIAPKNSSAGLDGHGDVNTEHYSLEFKTPGARVKSQKEHSATLIDSYLEDKVRHEYKINGRVDFKKVMSSQEAIENFMNSVQALGDEFAHAALTEDDWFDLFVGSLFAQYEITDKNMWVRLINYNRIKKDCIKALPNKKEFAKKMIRLMGCIQLKYYQQEENWSHIVIFKGKKGEQAVSKGEYACIPREEASDITKIFFDPHFSFKSGGNGYGSVRDHYCAVEYN